MIEVQDTVIVGVESLSLPEPAMTRVRRKSVETDHGISVRWRVSEPLWSNNHTTRVGRSFRRRRMISRDLVPTAPLAPATPTSGAALLRVQSVFERWRPVGLRFY